MCDPTGVIHCKILILLILSVKFSSFSMNRHLHGYNVYARELRERIPIV